MEDVDVSASDQQTLVSSFLEIAVGQTDDTARRFLQATNWKLDEAIQLYFVGGDMGTSALPTGTASPNRSTPGNVVDDGWIQHSGDEIRAPLPVVRETLYDGPSALYRPSRPGFLHEPRSRVAFRDFEEETRNTDAWESGQSAVSPSTTDPPRDTLASLYRPPFHMMYQGSFEKAKSAASLQDKWLLVNLQSPKEFLSHMLNRDTWADEAVAQTVKINFIFWQVDDDNSEGRKVRTYYKLESVPVVLVIDPITGQKMHSWCGMVQPEPLLEGLVPYLDGGPRDHHVTLSHKRPRGTAAIRPHTSKVNSAGSSMVPTGWGNNEDEELQRALAASVEKVKDTNSDDIEQISVSNKEETQTNRPMYPPLPEEPKCDKKLICRIGARLPDGRRVQRTFLLTDPIQLLWSFCYSQMGESETRKFKLTQSMPGSKSLEYESNLAFGDSGLANSMVMVTWE